MYTNKCETEIADGCPVKTIRVEDPDDPNKFDCKTCHEKCQKCSKPAKDSNKPNCTECLDPLFDAEKASDCTVCKDGYFKKDGKCKPCHPTCQTCMDSGDADNCTSCAGFPDDPTEIDPTSKEARKYYRVEPPNPPKKFECDCMEDFEVNPLSRNCVPIDLCENEPGTFRNSEDECEDCPAHCEECDHGHHCSECEGNWVVDDHEEGCECPAGYYAIGELYGWDLEEQMCEECSGDCVECTEDESCFDLPEGCSSYCTVCHEEEYDFPERSQCSRMPL
jgi:proprotein convertase subtilisin/kexin type 5